MLKKLARSFLILNSPCYEVTLDAVVPSSKQHQKNQSESKLLLLLSFSTLHVYVVCVFYRYVVTEERSPTQTQSMLIWLVLPARFLWGFHVSILTEWNDRGGGLTQQPSTHMSFWGSEQGKIALIAEPSSQPLTAFSKNSFKFLGKFVHL